MTIYFSCICDFVGCVYIYSNEQSKTKTKTMVVLVLVLLTQSWVIFFYVTVYSTAFDTTVQSRTSEVGGHLRYVFKIQTSSESQLGQSPFSDPHS